MLKIMTKPAAFTDVIDLYNFLWQEDIKYDAGKDKCYELFFQETIKVDKVEHIKERYLKNNGNIIIFNANLLTQSEVEQLEKFVLDNSLHDIYLIYDESEK